jgi:hypothetical protein
MIYVIYYLKRLIIILFFAINAILVSCDKDEAIIDDNDTQSVIDNIYADNSTALIFNIVNDYGIALMNEKAPKTDSGVVVTITPMYPLDSFPKTMIINYGNGILCTDGHQRKGKIITVFSNKWCFDSTKTNIDAEVILNDFYCDNIQHIANIAIGITENVEDGPEYTLQSSNSKLIFETSESTLWSTERIIKWHSGYQTLTNKNDDVYLITGTTTGISRKEKGYSSTITEPLQYDNSCSNGTLTKGIFEVVPQGLTKRVVDFGNGNCDRLATVTIDGISIEFTF